MATVMDYLDWRGDLTMEHAPFNVVDNLILAEIAYTDFEGTLPADGRPVKLSKICRKYFELHTREEIEARNTFTRDTPFLMEKAAGTKRFADMTISRYVNHISTESVEQFSAMLMRPGNGTTYVVFRGTDDTIVGWKEDFNLSFLSATEGQKQAAEYMNQALAHTAGPICVTGHSKGANFAIFASAFCKKNLRDRIVTIYSNDGPGFRPEIVKSPEYQEILPRITSIVPEESIIGVLLNTSGADLIVKSSNHGIMQHDGLSWQVLGDAFVTAPKRGDVSRLFEKTIADWLSGISDEERADFSIGLFSAFLSTGATTLEQLKENSAKSSAAIMTAMKNLPAEQQSICRTLIKSLIESSKDNISAGLKRRLKVDKRV